MISEREALKQILSAADERAETAELNLSIESAKLEQARNRNNTIVVLQQRVELLEGLLREASGELHDFITCGLLNRIDAVLNPVESGSDEN